MTKPPNKEPEVRARGRARPLSQTVNPDHPGREDLSRVLDRALVEAIADEEEFNEEPPTDISRVLNAVVEEFDSEEAPPGHPRNKE